MATEILNMGIYADLPWWAYVLITLGLTHITIAAVTIFLHRNQAHRSVELAKPVSHFFRFWLWISTGMNTKEWTAIHRKHHAKVETEEDPHSPQVAGILMVLFNGAGLYHEEAKNKATMEKYGFGTPDDAIERKLYTPYQNYGILIMLAIDLIMFGFIAGTIIWLVQMMWIPFWAAGVINGIGHYFGYRNFQTHDESRNIVPLAFFIGGEELHNNHHAYPTSSKLSSRWYEFDLGWAYIKLLESLNLAKVKRIAPRLHRSEKPTCDLDTLQSVLTNRFEVLTEFTDSVKRTCMSEGRKFYDKQGGKFLQSSVYQKWLSFRTKRLSKDEQDALTKLVASSEIMKKISSLNKDLASLWEDKEASLDQLVERLRTWCRNAEESGIESLKRFAYELRGFSSIPQTATVAVSKK